MKAITFIIISLLLHLSFHGQPNSSKDSLCFQNYNKAKSDYNSGRHKFCINATWDLPFSRMYDILDSLCKINNLILEPYPHVEHDASFDPYFCYSNFMDSMLNKKYGIAFKSRLCNVADSIFKKRHIHDTIPRYHCDINPTYSKSHDSLVHDFFVNFSIPDTCDFLRNCKDCFFRIIFVINLKGQASHYEIFNSNYPNYTCVDIIKRAIIQTLKKMNHWKPGILGGKKVISYGDLSIYIMDRMILE